MEVKATVNCLVSNILQNTFFCIEQKKLIHTGLDPHEGKLVNNDRIKFLGELCL